MHMELLLNFHLFYKYRCTSKFPNRIGIKTTKAIHNIYEISGNGILGISSVDPPVGCRKSESYSNSPMLIAIVFHIE